MKRAFGLILMLEQIVYLAFSVNQICVRQMFAWVNEFWRRVLRVKDRYHAKLDCNAVKKQIHSA